MRLGAAQLRLLRGCAWASSMGWQGYMTGRSAPLHVARSLERLGLVASAGLMHPCDGDGFVNEGRRMRIGWVLTDAGREALRPKGGA